MSAEEVQEVVWGRLAILPNVESVSFDPPPSLNLDNTIRDFMLVKVRCFKAPDDSLRRMTQKILTEFAMSLGRAEAVFDYPIPLNHFGPSDP